TAAEPVLEALKQIRGAARLVKCEPIATLASAVNDFLRAAREGKCELSAPALDWTRFAVATLAGALATDDETFPAWVGASAPALAGITEAFSRAARARSSNPTPVEPAPLVPARPTPPVPLPAGRGEKDPRDSTTSAVPVEASKPITPLPAGRGDGGGSSK